MNFEAVNTKHFPKQHRHYAALHQGPLATDCHGAANRCYWEFENGEGQMSMVILVIIKKSKKSSSQRPSVWVSKQTCCLYAAISCFSLGFCLPVLLFHNHAQVISIGEGSDVTRKTTDVLQLQWIWRTQVWLLQLKVTSAAEYMDKRSETWLHFWSQQRVDGLPCHMVVILV